MSYDELCAALIAECESDSDYIVEITSYYESEVFTEFKCTTYEIFSIGYNDEIIWFNDWYEGQQNCYYESPIKVDDLIRAYNITKQIKALRGCPEDCYYQILKIFEKEGDPI